ncbi:MAG: hypothetical protein M1833_002224 [Piccolia ochrophora]|nr:MAG: hypothetical protein M1833_002224 [Piccolia ochrophora]
MAQGASKTPKPQTGKTKRPVALAPKKGARAIAPKKATLVRQKKITKKHSAGLTAKTERLLAERVGHLEMLGGAKRGGSGDGKPTAENKRKSAGYSGKGK